MALGRRAALFIISYTPLAAMFLALRWPNGWPGADLARLGSAWPASRHCSSRFSAWLLPRAARSGALGVLATVGAALVVVAILKAWTHPLEFHPPKPHTSAATAAIALTFTIAGIGLLLVILRNAARGTPASWTVTDPRDQGAAVAGYLASYLLPLLNPGAHGTRIGIAYAIYLLTLFIIFMRSAGLVTINPMIYMVGYRIFDVQLMPPEPIKPRRVLVLSKHPLKCTTQVDAVALGDDCYVVVTGEEP